MFVRAVLSDGALLLLLRKAAFLRLVAEAAQLHGKRGGNMHGNAFGLIKILYMLLNYKAKNWYCKLKRSDL